MLTQGYSFVKEQNMVDRPAQRRWTMNRLLMYAIVVCSLAIGACATSPFPSDVMKDVDPNAGFGVLQAQPDVYKGRAVELAGMIVDMQNLPLRENKPVEALRETKESVQPGGAFTVLYPGTIAKSEFEFGDKVVVVGKAGGEKQSRPYLVASCIHVWKTGLYPISQYEDLADLGLEQRTYCAR